MRKQSVKFFSPGLLGSLLVLAPGLSAQGIFPDKNLEAAVRQYVPAKKANQEPLTAADVASLAHIEARGKGIKDLTGLDQCAGVGYLDLSGNEITDLTPLAKLGSVMRPKAPKEDTYLQYLNLAKNKITDLKPLGSLVKLQLLDLSENQVTDLTPLANMKSLNTLYLSQNKVKDLTPLAGLERLWTLYVDGNAVVDIKPVAKLKRLSSLDLRGNPVTDLTPVAALLSLHDLLVDANRVKDLTALVKVAQKDFQGDKVFAPYLRLHLTGAPPAAVKTQLATLQKYGVQVNTLKPGAARPAAQ
jgi:Leucine-rich repeat (LRR) protein